MCFVFAWFVGMLVGLLPVFCCWLAPCLPGWLDGWLTGQLLVFHFELFDPLPVCFFSVCMIAWFVGLCAACAFVVAWFVGRLAGWRPALLFLNSLRLTLAGLGWAWWVVGYPPGWAGWLHDCCLVVVLF